MVGVADNRQESDDRSREEGVKKEREAHAMFHKYEVKPDQASTTKAWKYYAVMFKTIDKAEKMQKKLKAKYA